MGLVKKRHPRIGVYVCHCGQNISSVVNVSEVRKYAESLPNVVLARENKYTCSDLGQSSIARDIKKHGLDRVVVASCSPRLHEIAFRDVLDESGLNPYLFEMVNIREQCSWVHPNNKKQATKKAKDLIRAAVARSTLLEPVDKIKKDVTKAVLVVGGGIAGITSALYLARVGIKTILVDKEPSIGGTMAKLDKTYPTLDCSLCTLSPKMVDVKKEENIRLYAYTDIVDIEGYVGNFNIRLRKKPRIVDEDKCIACGECAAACPVKVKDEFNQRMNERKAIYIPFPQAVPNSYLVDVENCLYFKTRACRLCEKKCDKNAIDFSQKETYEELDVGAIIIATGFSLFDAKRKKEYGYSKYPNVVSNLDFERMLSADGPTKGKIKRPLDAKKPSSISFIQCVGSRDEAFNNYCSAICCMASLKQAMQVKEKNPEIEVNVYYNDIRAAGKDFEEFFGRCRQRGINFLRGLPPEVVEDPDSGDLFIRSEDLNMGRVLEKKTDLVVLAAGLEPSASVERLCKNLHLNQSPDGFIMEAHPKLRPVDTNIAGVYIAGCAQYPKGIPESVAQGGSAAMAAAEIVLKDEIPMEATTAYVMKDKCSGCGLCVNVCPYDAIRLTKEGVVKINEILCKGCGSCAAICPSSAIAQTHFLDSQINAQIEALLES